MTQDQLKLQVEADMMLKFGIDAAKAKELAVYIMANGKRSYIAGLKAGKGSSNRDE